MIQTLFTVSDPEGIKEIRQFFMGLHKDNEDTSGFNVLTEKYCCPERNGSRREYTDRKDIDDAVDIAVDAEYEKTDQISGMFGVYESIWMFQSGFCSQTKDYNPATDPHPVVYPPLPAGQYYIYQVLYY